MAYDNKSIYTFKGIKRTGILNTILKMGEK